MKPRLFWTMGAILAAVCGLMTACGRVDRSPVRIGVQGPMSGDLAYEGVGFYRALQLLADQVNDRGGVLGGRPVEVVVGDDRGDSEEARRVAERLVAEGVVAVVGSYNSDATAAASAIYAEAGVLQITPASTVMQLTEQGCPGFFRTCSTNARQAQCAAGLMVDDLQRPRVALVHDHSLYAYELAALAQAAIEVRGGTVVLSTAVRLGQRDFTALIQELTEREADALYFTGYYVEGGLLARQMYESGLEVQFVGGDALDTPEFVAYAGPAAAGTFVTTELLAQDMLQYPETAAFVADYEQAYGEFPASNRTLGAADGFRLVVYAIEQTGSDDPALLADYLHDELADFAGITGPIEGFDEQGNRVGAISVVYQIDAGGQFVLYRR
ncbi:MAG: branched-chain amino acid ABC transporter substrate-binding protein [Anaerolineae bacterium]|nr:branched-chain amino acid ABC transporter substrate-binding protein [Anaerolineae bacterium]